MVRGAALDSSRSSKRKPTTIAHDAVEKIEGQLASHGRTIQVVPINIIDLGENIRLAYDSDELKKLAQSIKSDGLIQFPTLGLKKTPTGPKLVCRNGHRRILAAELLGWDKIECVILPFDSHKQEMFHSLNANMRETMFYLDIAEAYDKVHKLGESDQAIALRVGMNQRTIRWYRRLVEMSPACKSLIRANPELFNATWAIQLARLGDLPSPKVLESWMNRMVKLGKTFITEPKEDSPEPKSNKERSEAITGLQKHFKGRDGAGQIKWAHDFLHQLTRCGYLSPRLVARIEGEIFGAKAAAEGKPSKRQ